MGKSTSCKAPSDWNAGHPHAGGEIAALLAVSVTFSGPSPRGWGNLIYGRSYFRELRAIPMRVGKSGAGRRWRGARTGHPHAGGEIWRPGSTPRQNYGPSPRGWGNHFHFNRLRSLARAIPTRVGKSLAPPVWVGGIPGHPHAGGEITKAGRRRGDIVGPSPRGWGNPCNVVRAPLRARAIPTRVGKSPGHSKMIIFGPGHPHAGGEIPVQPADTDAIAGPSPRGWGNQQTT